MGKILVPFDFSKCASEALKTAEDFAYKTGLEIVLLNIYEAFIVTISDPISPYNIGSMYLYKDEKEEKKVIKQKKDALDKICNELRGRSVKVSYKLIEKTSYDKVSNVILSESSLTGYQMILMGTHGMSGWQETFLGSNAQRVVREAKIPVFVVKKHHTILDFSKLVYVSDFKEVSKAKHLLTLLGLFKKYIKSVDLLYINTFENFEETQISLERVHKFAKKLPLKGLNVQIFNAYSPEKGVLEYAKLNQADMYLIGTHGYTGVKHVFNYNITEFLVNHLNKPLITFNLR